MTAKKLIKTGQRFRDQFGRYGYGAFDGRDLFDLGMTRLDDDG